MLDSCFASVWPDVHTKCEFELMRFGFDPVFAALEAQPHNTWLPF